MIINDSYLTVRFANKIAEICAPLKTIGIVYCHYSKVYADGSASLLVSNADWHKHDFKKEMPGPWPTKKAVIKPGRYLWNPIYDPELIRDACKGFGIANGFLYIKKSLDYYEIFSFGFDALDFNSFNFFFNNKDFFDKFAFYFKNQAFKLLKMADNDRLILPNSMTENPHLNDNSDFEPYEAIKKNILQQILNGVNSKQKIPSFTEREIDCLIHIARGRTAKETARILDLSSRTVESYLASARLKANCSSKSQLADIFLTHYKNCYKLL